MGSERGRPIYRKVVDGFLVLPEADTIRYAVEKLPSEALSAISIEVDEERYDAKQIRALYENDGYPLARK
jgi:hypothetical protein